jgi:S-adenosylmethionine:tRNA ribosyltransferase-isomerase
MKTSDFDYHLPKELIAQTPMEPRDHSRLMVVSRADGSILHRRFYDLPNYLRHGDLLVFNDSRVFPARLHGTRTGTGGRIELLLLHRLSPGVWRALVRPGRRMRQGDAFEVAGGGHTLRGEVLQVSADGSRTVRLSDEGALDVVGVVPLPPYIHKPLEDAERYQTVYSRVMGSVAAPTAGLHFTPGLLERVRSLGMELTFVTLHVGWDSFRPVKTEDVASHRMHAEYYEVDETAADAVNRAKREGRRVVCVGTTAVRLLEQAAVLNRNTDDDGDRSDSVLIAGSGWADLFIYPGYRFRVVDALVTNFHLPRSTLLMLTSAFAGRELILEAYRVAAEDHYRFYSFGDGMIIL